MYVHSVKLINFKSFGDYPENEVILEPRVTAIIGKNESGKSNVLEGLSQILFKRKQNAAFFTNNVNRSRTDAAIQFIITLQLTPAEIDEFGAIPDTTVAITKESYRAIGGILDIYNEMMGTLVDDLQAALAEINNNPFQLRDAELSSYKTYKLELDQKEHLDIPRTTAAFDFYEKKLSSLPAANRDDIANKLNAAKSKWSNFLNLLPVFFYRRTDKRLSTSYKYEDIQKELNNPDSAPNSLLSSFIKVIGVSSEDFLSAARSGSTAPQESVRRRINRLVNERINQKFSRFYQTEEINLDLGFNAGVVTFVIQSNNGEAFLLSERSNGLRWYLETFIDALANDISDRNVVYLLDEPGTSLHVNAQRELLRLFGELADKGNQVVYTTHSPYMLNLEAEGLHRIRAVTKNSEGYSHIYKSAYDARIAPDSQQDTLAPVISALGMNLNDTVGPALDKINIVTEGMSDYIYLCTMAKQVDIDLEKYAFIPAVGATNCVKICSILHGWGCKCVALFDYDNEGVELGGEYMRTEMLFECGTQYCYVREVSSEEIDQKTYNATSFMIEDVMTQSEIQRYCDEAGTSKECGKPLTAKLMCNAIESGRFTVSKESLDNFTSLFARITSI